jgi:hypothetical protein
VAEASAVEREAAMEAAMEVGPLGDSTLAVAGLSRLVDRQEAGAKDPAKPKHRQRIRSLVFLLFLLWKQGKLTPGGIPIEIDIMGSVGSSTGPSTLDNTGTTGGISCNWRLLRCFMVH